MPKKPPCPECGAKLEIKGLVDSNDRIWLRWKYCPNCKWDERAKIGAPTARKVS